MDKEEKTLVGVQNSVIGFDDPFHPQSCGEYLRTGEQQVFSSQDPTPSVEEYLALLRKLDVDFYVHHSIPKDDEIIAMIKRLDGEKLPFILGNEFYSINGLYAPGTGRGEHSVQVVEEALESSCFMGLLYDETEHRQLHSKQYCQETDGYEWADPHGKTASRVEADIVAEIGRVRKKFHDCPLFSEHVFPVLYHTFCRGGMNPCPKLLKEEYQPLQLACAMGAAKQYGRKLSLCVDLWGFDVGNWFTRLWGFPAHSPAEFKSALELGHYLAPYMMFVENIDSLAQNTEDGFVLTEFGEIFKVFKKEFVPTHPLEYSFEDVTCDIAVVRSDDSYISKSGNFDGNGFYGSQDLHPTEESNSFFDVMYALLHKTASDCSVTYHKSNWKRWPAGDYPRTPENLATLPLLHGVGVEQEVTCHPIFHPMSSTLVFDQYVKSEDISAAKLIVLCGSYLAKTTSEVIAQKINSGATAIIPRWFSAHFQDFRGQPGWIFVDDFKGAAFETALAPYLGSPWEWVLRFGDKRLVVTNPTHDGRTLRFEFTENNGRST